MTRKIQSMAGKTLYIACEPISPRTDIPVADAFTEIFGDCYVIYNSLAELEAKVSQDLQLGHDDKFTVLTIDIKKVQGGSIVPKVKLE